ncbi:carbohydrate ABC transporter permease [Euzebya tangerina]|uniref:carbohydrate ABC transporter permease n=1 Tax=Euzebya tangerina TaxID=591198 RepID=UPI000E324A3B|nr:sugar ABC transporter permease [Euzebya tangerina]
MSSTLHTPGSDLDTNSGASQQGPTGTSSWVAVLLGWRVLHAVAASAGAVWLFGSDTPEGRLADALAVVAIVIAVADVAAAVAIRARRHLGRSISLVLDYLTFLGAALVLLQITDTFVGLDALASNFPVGAPIVVASIVVLILTGSASPRTRRVGRWVSIVLAGVALVVVGLLPGLATFASRVAQPVPGLLLVLAIVVGFITWRTYQPDVGRLLGANRQNVRTLEGLLFASPNVLGFLAFFAGPLLFSLYVSLNEWDAFSAPAFIGLDNYVRILSLDFALADGGSIQYADGYREAFRFGSVGIGARDPLFWTSIRNIVVFAVLAIPAAVIPALALAQLLNVRAPGMKIFRAVFFVPSIAGVVAVALIWKQLFNATVGWLNYLLGEAANLVSVLPGIELVAPEPRWLSDASVSLLSLVIVFAWQYIGFNTVLFLAGLQGLDGTVYEAATLDGANAWQKFRYLTLPALRPTTFFVVASTGILALQLFGEAIVLFPPIGAGPQNSTLTPVVYLYDQGFRQFSQGYASAVAWVLFALIFAFTFVQFRRQRDEATEGGV